jgi:hypothetical protein
VTVGKVQVPLRKLGAEGHRALVPRSVYKPGEGRKLIGMSATDRDADP